MSATHPFADMYEPYDSERAAFGEHWTFKGTHLTHCEDVLVAFYGKNPADGDGQSVEVYCCALPARFYTLKVLPSANSCLEEQDGYTVEFGSGQQPLAASIAKAISDGMCGFNPTTPKDPV